MRFFFKIFYGLIIYYVSFNENSCCNYFFTIHINMSVSCIVTKASVFLQVFKQAVNIRMVEGNHRTIVNKHETAIIINSFIL